MNAATKIIAAVLVRMVLGAAFAFAFTMEPMSALLAPSGAGSVATFRLHNDSGERVAVKFEVLSRDTAADGSELNGPAEGLFKVYPARVLVEPGSVAAVKVQWIGPAGLAAERPFRFRAEEVPLQAAGQPSSGIRVMFRYVASLYVGTEAFAPELRASVLGAVGQDGSSGFLIEIRNSGTRHVVAESLSLAMASRTGSWTDLPAEAIGALSGANYLPGTSRRLFVADADATPGARYEARIDYEAEY